MSVFDILFHCLQFQVRCCAEKGRGVYTLKPLKKKDYVMEYKGDLLTYAEGKLREASYETHPDISSYMFFLNFKDKKFWLVVLTCIEVIFTSNNFSSSKVLLQLSFFPFLASMPQLNQNFLAG